MKKMNILFILIMSILIFGTTNVYAEQLENYVFSLDSNNNSYGWVLNGSVYEKTSNGNFNGASLYFDSTSLTKLRSKSNLYISAYAFITNQTNNQTISLNNINFNETCTQYGQGGGNNPIQGSITYADGTQASIDLATINRLCQSWQSSGSSSGTITNNNFDNNPVFFITIGNSGNTNYVCEYKGGSLFKCNTNVVGGFNRIGFNFYQDGYPNTIKLVISRYVSISDTDTTTIINNQQQINNSIIDTNNTITTPTIDSNTTNTDSLITIPNSNGKNVVLDLLMTPVNLFTNIVNSFSNSCVSYNLGNLLGTDLILPCVNLQNILGSSLYTIIDSIFAFGMLFAFIRSVKRFIQKALLLASDVSSEVSIF